VAPVFAITIAITITIAVTIGTPPAASPVTANHTQQKPLAQTAIGDGKFSYRPAPINCFQDGATGQNQISALTANARIGGQFIAAQPA
jgi:hypothetical protein